MRRMSSFVVGAVAALLVTGVPTPASAVPVNAAPASAAPAPGYTARDLGPLDGFETVAVDLNDRGDVVGTINPAWDDRAFRIVGGVTEVWGETDHYVDPLVLNDRGAALVKVWTRRMPHSERVALWSGATRTILNPPGTFAGGAGDLADSGRAVIVYGPDQLTQDTIALVQGGTIVRTHHFAGWTIRDPRITSAGLVAATLVGTNSVVTRAVVWDRNRITLLPEGTNLRALTERGQVFVDGPAGARSWYRGRLSVLARPAGTQVRLADANLFGVAVGEADLPAGQRGVVISRGRATVLPTLGGGWSRAFLVNDRGEVAGISETASGAWHGFRWFGGRMTDLGTLPQVTGQAVQRLVALNSRGQVFGNSQISPSQYTRATIWTPVRR